MLATLQLSAAISPWSLRRRQPPQRRVAAIVTRCAAVLHKQSDRFLTSLATVAAGGDATATNRLIRKFVSSAPKSIALSALSHLLSPRTAAQSNLSSLALPLYSRMTEAPWFDWNPKLVAELVALLDEQGLHTESQILISDAISKIEHKERDLAQFYSNLINFQSKRKSKIGFDDSCNRLTQLLQGCKSKHVKRQAFESLVGGLCEMGQPGEAEKIIEEMRGEGLNPSGSQLKYLVYAYGQLGLFEDMQRIVHEMEAEGFSLDTVCSTMVLSSFGAHGDFPKMVTWIQKMKTLAIPFSIRTYNTILNSCPMIMSLLQDDLRKIPISTDELVKSLDVDEGSVVEELMGSSVMECAMEWGVSEVKLDLHGMHLGSAYLVMLQWMEEMRGRLNGGDCAIPGEVVVVCWSGRHSRVRGESPVKKMVTELMVRTKSPMRVDRKNIGCFVAKGKVVKNWLCCELK